MQSGRLTLPIGIACAVLGFGAGVALMRRPVTVAGMAAAPPRTEERPHDIVVVGPTTGRLDEGDKQTLRAIVREELAAERTSAATNASAGSGTDTAPKWQLSSDAMKVYDGVRVDVDNAVARGIWSDEDRADLRPGLAQLPTEARLEAMRPLIVAVNQGKVRFAGRGPLF